MLYKLALLSRYEELILLKCDLQFVQYRGTNQETGIWDQSCYWTQLGSACQTHRKANLLTPGCVEGKYSTYFWVPSKNKQLMLKRLPSGFQGRGFKGKVRERVVGNVFSSCTVFWLVGGEVTRWSHRSQHYQPSGSSWSGGYVLTVTNSSSAWVLISGKQLKNVD